MRHQEPGRRRRFLGSCFQIAKQDAQSEGAADTCEERTPSQAIRASHGAAPARRAASVEEAAISRIKSLKVCGVSLKRSITPFTAQLFAGRSSETSASE